MSTPPHDEYIRALRAKLEVLDRRRRRIIEELEEEGESVEDLTFSAPIPAHLAGMHARYVVPAFPVVPEAEKTRLRQDPSNKQNGISRVFLDVARKYPGLDVTQLINRVLDYVITDEPLHRGNLRGMVRYLVDTNRLEKRDGRYWPKPSDPAKQDDQATLAMNGGE
jgi:hypothetical protein